MEVLSRTFQRVMTATTGLMCREPDLMIGRGSLYDVIISLKRKQVKRIMLATTKGTIRRGTLNGFLEELEHAEIEAEIFNDIMADPTVECAELQAKAYVDAGCEALVAIGGGSVIDCSKAALAKVVNPKKSVRKFKGVMNVRHRIPDLYAVPTTAGTGSEATAASVVTDTINEVHYKYAISDPVLIPRYAVLDPDLSITLPPGMTGTTGMDALTHAVEAYTNRFASKKVRETASEAVRLIFENLPKAYEDGKNYQARENMLLGSYYAGIAFTNNFVGYVHAVAHAIGAIYGLSHGYSIAVILPWVMEQYGGAAHKELAELARYAGIVGAEEALSDAECAGRFIQAIREMNEKIGVPQTFAELRAEDYDEIAKRAMSEANPVYPVPAIWGKKDFIELLKKLQG